jgi:hypothetical protein
MPKLIPVLVAACLVAAPALFAQDTAVRTGRLVYVTAPRRAAVAVDGQARGYTPLLLDLAPGAHALEARAPAGAFRTALAVDAETAGVTRLAAVLAPEPAAAAPAAAPTAAPTAAAQATTGRLRFAAFPAGTRILVDGAHVDPADIASGLEVETGPHAIVVQAPGCLPDLVWRIVEAGGEAAVEAKLEADPAFSAKGRRAVAVPVLLVGLGLAASGFALNLDAVAIGLTPDYAAYAALKYASLGVFGSGMAAALAGAGLFVF